MADENAVPLSIAVPEALVLGLPASDDPPDEVLELARDADVIAIGPGLDDIGRTTELMHVILGAAGEDSAVVLDAYALGALSKEPGLLWQRRAVLTPNVTEAGHLLGRAAGQAQAACWGAYAHTVSGQRLAPRFGRTGFLARELVDEVAYTIATV